MVTRTDLERMYDVADDDEAAVLDELQHRAGILWTCEGPHAPGQPSRWTQPTGETCDVCGRAVPQQTA